jgi:hypothetical protein
MPPTLDYLQYSTIPSARIRAEKGIIGTAQLAPELIPSELLPPQVWRQRGRI